MEKKKHYIKVFFTDDEDGYVVNYDGTTTDVRQGNDHLASGIGYDIKGEIDEDIEKHDVGIYGYRIDYTLTPITTDPFK